MDRPLLLLHVYKVVARVLIITCHIIIVYRHDSIKRSLTLYVAEDSTSSESSGEEDNSDPLLKS